MRVAALPHPDLCLAAGCPFWILVIIGVVAAIWASRRF
jgi:hypothetical protein